VTAVRDRERAAPKAQQQAWIAVRAAIHAALGDRGSKVALYDLRETLESARTALPVEFIAALVRIGDTSCLEPIALAYAHGASADGDRDWWHEHLADAFRAIVTRDRVTRRHAAIKRIEKRSPAALQALWPARAASTLSRTRPRR
jgi:HEAT repeat protein